MYHRIEAMPGEYVLKGVSVKEINSVKYQRFPRDFLHPLEGFLFGVHEVVYDNDFMACLQEFNAGMTSDVSCSACDQYLQWVLPRGGILLDPCLGLL
jgi:hypothetical protein